MFKLNTLLTLALLLPLSGCDLFQKSEKTNGYPKLYEVTATDQTEHYSQIISRYLQTPKMAGGFAPLPNTISGVFIIDNPSYYIIRPDILTNTQNTAFIIAEEYCHYDQYLRGVQFNESTKPHEERSYEIECKLISQNVFDYIYFSDQFYKGQTQ